VVPEILEKELLELPLPMTRDSDELERAHKAAVDAICFYLRKGMDVAFLTLGDVSIYSTYGHLCERVRACGFEAEMISGVPSFCAAAARIGETLAIAGKPLQILPASYHGLEEGLRRAGTKVLMKTGHSLRAVKEKLRELGLYEKAKLVENCGLPDEHIYHSLDQVGEEAGYFSLIVVQE
jgi:precorrin-2/cobalt-factor-2 C20-methyltransferase